MRTLLLLQSLIRNTVIKDRHCLNSCLVTFTCYKNKNQPAINARTAPERMIDQNPIEFSDIDFDESADERKSLLSERKPQTFDENVEIKKAIKRKNLIKKDQTL